MSGRSVVAGVLGRRKSSALEERLGAPARVWEPGPDGTPPRGVGLGGPVRAPLTPLAVRPSGVSRREAVQMLLAAIEGLPTDRADRSLLVRAEAAWEPADVVILASLIERARALPAARPVAAGPDARWVTWCPECQLPTITGPVSLGEAEALSRAHDRVWHGGAWVGQVVEVPPAPEQARAASRTAALSAGLSGGAL